MLSRCEGFTCAMLSRSVAGLSAQVAEPWSTGQAVVVMTAPNGHRPGDYKPGDVVPPDRAIDAAGRNVPAVRPKTHSTPKIASSRLVAATLSDVWTPDEITHWLTSVIRGVDPNVKINDKTGRPEAHVPPDWTMRRWAFETMLNRSLGKVKAHVVLENQGAPLVDVKIATFALDARDLDKTLPEAELTAFRKMQAAIVARAKKKVEALTAGATAGAAAGVIDVTSDE